MKPFLSSQLTPLAAAAFQARILESTEDLQRAMFSYLVAASDASGQFCLLLKLRIASHTVINRKQPQPDIKPWSDRAKRRRS